MEIDLGELKTIINRLLDHAIDKRGVTSVRLEKNYYWNISEESRYDMAIKVPDFDVGSLVDDWGFVSHLLDKESDPIVYQLTEVAPILRYVGESLGRELAKYGG